jgi:hypothetical protein
MMLSCEKHPSAKSYTDQNNEVWCVDCRDELIRKMVADPEIRKKLGEAMMPRTASAPRPVSLGTYIPAMSLDEEAHFGDLGRDHYTKPENPGHPQDIISLGWTLVFTGPIPDKGTPTGWCAEFRREGESVRGAGKTLPQALNSVRWQLCWEDPYFLDSSTPQKGDLLKCSECGVRPPEPQGDMCPKCLCGVRSGCPRKYGEDESACPHAWCPQKAR